MLEVLLFFSEHSRNDVEIQMGRTEQQVLRALDPISSPGSGSSTKPTKPLLLSLLQFLDEGSEHGRHWGWNSLLTIYPSPGGGDEGEKKELTALPWQGQADPK